jgi:hypothetical protein
MPVQLSLLDDEDAPRKSTPVWSALPDKVRAELSERVAALLLRILRPLPTDGEIDDDDVEDQVAPVDP